MGDTWTAKDSSTMPELINLEDSEESEEEEGLRKRGTANGEGKTPVSLAIKANIVYYKVSPTLLYSSLIFYPSSRSRTNSGICSFA